MLSRVEKPRSSFLYREGDTRELFCKCLSIVSCGSLFALPCFYYRYRSDGTMPFLVDKLNDQKCRSYRVVFHFSRQRAREREKYSWKLISQRRVCHSSSPLRSLNTPLAGLSHTASASSRNVTPPSIIILMLSRNS